MLLNLALVSATDDPKSVTNTLIGIGVEIGIGVSVWAIKRALVRRRTEGWKTAAQDMGFTFDGEDWTDRKRAPVLESALFGKGHGGEYKNITTGSRDGLRVSLFDYSYTVGGARAASNIVQTVGAFSKDSVSLPYFEMWPSDTLDRVWDKVAHKSMHFESNPEFTRHYFLQSPSEDRVRSLFTPGLLSFLEQINPEAKWTIEGSDDTLILYHPKWSIAPAEVRSFLDRASSIASSFFSLANCPVEKSKR